MKDLRKDFPILKETNNGHQVIYFDSAATSQKPQQVLDAVMKYYTTSNANIHRGAHFLAERATDLYEKSREKVAQFLGASSASEIVFTRGATESINLVAASWAMANVGKDDQIVTTELEHHANLVTWQEVCKKTGATLAFIPALPNGLLDMSTLDTIITKNTKLVACTYVSNAVGSHVDIKTIIKKAHSVGARVLIDVAQAAPYQKINVTDMDCDFLVLSGHKMLAPTGIGVLYIKKDLHEEMSPYQVGGGMIFEVTLRTATWQKVPARLEAGTPAIAQAVGLGAAIDYLNEFVDWTALRKHEAALCTRMIEGLQQFKTVKIFGPIDELKVKGHLVPFEVAGLHAHDVAGYLDTFGICMRAGHHCAQPLAHKLGIEASCRASFYLYNTLEEVDQVLEAIATMHKDLLGGME